MSRNEEASGNSRTLRFHEYGKPEEVVKIAGDPKRVLTITDFATAKETRGPREMSEDLTYRFDVLAEYAQLAAEGKFEVPIARTYALDEWRDALQLSQSSAARGKVILSLDEPGD